MASRSPSPRTLAIAGAAAVALALGVGVYINNSTPVATPPAPSKPAAPVVASKAPAASAPARTAAPRAVPADEPATRPVATRTKEQASAALMALPELQAWSAMLEKNSGGKVRGALIEYDPTPRKLNGKSYWQFSFVENSAESAQRWESFLVSSSDDEILVEDATNDEVISLARWRREKHPEKRISIDG